MHSIFHQRSPPYLKLKTSTHSASVEWPQRRQLRSSAARSAVVLPTTTQFGRRAFSVCGPDIWNRLPVNIRLTDSHAAFRRAPKTSLLTSLLFCSLLVSGWTFVLHSCSFYVWLGTIIGHCIYMYVCISRLVLHDILLSSRLSEVNRSFSA